MTMALTVAELIVELSGVGSQYDNKAVVAYDSDEDRDFSITGIEINYDANPDGDVLITLESAPVV